jgi:hypothetical protein
VKYNIDKYKKLLPESFSISKEADLKNVENAALEILKDYPESNDLAAIEKQLIESSESQMSMSLAIKLARSKAIVKQIKKPLCVSVTFAMYKENNRILPATEHPNGENFLMVKLHQLEWLFGDDLNIEWELLPVDDGCPEGSGKIAEEILHKNHVKENAKVLFLADAIENKLPIAQSLSSTNDSQKGGSIEYGMWFAAQKPCTHQHIIVFTDADLSTHLGQTGLLLEPLLAEDKSVAIGSRREINSVVIKKGVRNTRGKLFIYLWKRMLPELNYLVDTQCGFKAFKHKTLITIVDDLIETKFAFDIELLLKAELLLKHSIAKVGIAWIDSEAESTTTDIQPYLPMLKSIAKMYLKYTGENKESEQFADFILSLNNDQWNKLVKNVPDAIAAREPIEFVTFNEVTVSDFKDILS